MTDNGSQVYLVADYKAGTFKFNNLNKKHKWKIKNKTRN